MQGVYWSTNDQNNSVDFLGILLSESEIQFPLQL